ncbi:MAG: response regulator [Ignavibacteriae bacterium]|nr:response regulator [Ignavibacteriota bacterium]
MAHMTILVVDDESSYSTLLSDVLASHKHHVVSAMNGSEAIKLLQSESVNLILCDIEMPVMNGIAFHQHLQNDKSLRKIPFCFLTGSDNPAHRNYAAQFPSVNFIPKSEVMSKLIPLLTQLS